MSAWVLFTGHKQETSRALPLLNRGLLLEAQFDHPLTPWALLVGGRIALDASQYDTARKHLNRPHLRPLLKEMLVH